ncbi:MAG: MFS transporter [Actinomycetota bacterium]|nr:MFS transporter [Actinomycetota bacterium]
MGDLRLLLRGRDFRRLFAVRLVGQFADGVFQVTLTSYVLFSPERQPTPTAIAAAFAAVLLPFSVLGPFAGVLIDRWSRRQVLVWSNVFRTGVLLLVAALVHRDVVGPGLFVAVLAALSVNRFLLAALSAALPHVVDRDRLVMANAVTPTSGTAAFVAGLSAGAGWRDVLERYGGPGHVSVVVTAAATYAAAALLATRMHRGLLGPDFEAARPGIREHTRRVLVGLVDGLAHLRQRREAALALGAIGLHRYFYGISAVATILLYRGYLYGPADPDRGFAGLAVAVLVSGLGFVTAALATPVVTRWLSKQRWVLVLLVLAAVVEVVPGALYTEPSLLVAAYALGFSAQGVKICVDTLVQEHVDDAFRGRVFAVYDVVFNVAFVAAAATGAVILPPDGKSYSALALIALGYAGTALTYWWSHASRRQLPLAATPPR